MINLQFLIMIPLKFLLSLNFPKSFDLHHKILLLFFFLVPLFDLLLLLQLLISDSNNLCIHDHFIHFLDIIFVFISKASCFLNDSCLAFLLSSLLIIHW